MAPLGTLTEVEDTISSKRAKRWAMKLLFETFTRYSGANDKQLENKIFGILIVVLKLY